ncbi:MAG: NADH-quinone oxidoreductase subunit C [Terriglobia bacterium]
MADEQDNKQPPAPKAGPGEPAPAAAKPPAAPAAKPAAKAPPSRPKPPAPEPLDNEMIRRLRARFGDAIGEASTDRGQPIVIVQPARLLEAGRYLREEEKFNLLEDLTAVDWYDRRPRFDLILNLYSFERNQRLRVKVPTGDTCPSVAALWPTANWLEREAFDMFGLRFQGHPNLKRILLPDEWSGHPLRKDYDILKQDTDWVRENLGIESGQ